MKVESMVYGINSAEVCPECGYKQDQSLSRYILLDCQRCGANLISFGPGKKEMVEVEISSKVVH